MLLEVHAVVPTDSALGFTAGIKLTKFMDVLGSPLLIVRTVSVDLKQH